MHKLNNEGKPHNDYKNNRNMILNLLRQSKKNAMISTLNTISII